MTDQYIAQILDLPYTMILKLDDEGDMTARVQEWEGCVADGSDVTEALAHLRSMMRLWIEAAVADGREIPMPRQEPDSWEGWQPRLLRPRDGQRCHVLLDTDTIGVGFVYKADGDGFL